MCSVSAICNWFESLPDEWFTLDRLEKFKSVIELAEFLDQETGQPNCADSEKAKIKERIDELEYLIKEYRGADHE